jgi:hypothetical protein
LKGWTGCPACSKRARGRGKAGGGGCGCPVTSFHPRRRVSGLHGGENGGGGAADAATALTPTPPPLLSLPHFFLRRMSVTSSRLALPREWVPSLRLANLRARFSRPVWREGRGDGGGGSAACVAAGPPLLSLSLSLSSPHLEQLADALLVRRQAGDFADDLAHDLDALRRALRERGGIRSVGGRSVATTAALNTVDVPAVAAAPAGGGRGRTTARRRADRRRRAPHAPAAARPAPAAPDRQMCAAAVPQEGAGDRHTPSVHAARAAAPRRRPASIPARAPRGRGGPASRPPGGSTSSAHAPCRAGSTASPPLPQHAPPCATQGGPPSRAWSPRGLSPGRRRCP